MNVKIARQEDRILIYGYEGIDPIILEHDEAVEVAQRMLDLAGHMAQQQDEETIA